MKGLLVGLAGGVQGAGTAVAEIADDKLKQLAEKLKMEALEQIQVRSDQRRFANDTAMEGIRTENQKGLLAQQNIYGQESQSRGFEHADKAQKSSQDFQLGLEGVRQKHAERLQDKGFSHTEAMEYSRQFAQQVRDFTQNEHQGKMQKSGQEHTEKLADLSKKHAEEMQQRGFDHAEALEYSRQFAQQVRDATLSELKKGEAAHAANIKVPADNSFKSLPDEIRKSFEKETVDQFGNTTKSFDNEGLARYTQFMESSGVKDPRRAYALWSMEEAKKDPAFDTFRAKYPNEPEEQVALAYRLQNRAAELESGGMKREKAIETAKKEYQAIQAPEQSGPERLGTPEARAQADTPDPERLGQRGLLEPRPAVAQPQVKPPVQPQSSESAFGQPFQKWGGVEAVKGLFDTAKGVGASTRADIEASEKRPATLIDALKRKGFRNEKAIQIQVDKLKKNYPDKSEAELIDIVLKSR